MGIRAGSPVPLLPNEIIGAGLWEVDREPWNLW